MGKFVLNIWQSKLIHCEISLFQDELPFMAGKFGIWLWNVRMLEMDIDKGWNGQRKMTRERSDSYAVRIKQPDVEERGKVDWGKITKQSPAAISPFDEIPEGQREKACAIGMKAIAVWHTFCPWVRERRGERRGIVFQARDLQTRHNL